MTSIRTIIISIMNLLYANIRSAHNNFPVLVANLANLNIHPEIFALAETWFRDDVYYYFPNFSFCGVGSRIGGGVGFYYRNDLQFSSIPEMCLFSENIESYGIKNNKNNDIYIVIYRPHTANFNVFIKNCENLIHLSCNGNIKRRVCMAGDFNATTPCGPICQL